MLAVRQSSVFSLLSIQSTGLKPALNCEPSSLQRGLMVWFRVWTGWWILTLSKLRLLWRQQALHVYPPTFIQDSTCAECTVSKNRTFEFVFSPICRLDFTITSPRPRKVCEGWNIYFVVGFFFFSWRKFQSRTQGTRLFLVGAFLSPAHDLSCIKIFIFRFCCVVYWK